MQNVPRFEHRGTFCTPLQVADFPATTLMPLSFSAPGQLGSLTSSINKTNVDTTEELVTPMKDVSAVHPVSRDSFPFSILSRVKLFFISKDECAPVEAPR